MQYTEEQIAERYDALPEKLRVFINDNQYRDLVEAIAEKNHLDDKKTAALGKIVGLVVVGLVHPEDIAEEVAEQTGIDKRVGELLAKEVKQKVLSAISADLKELYGFSLSGEVNQPETNQPDQPQQPQEAPQTTSNPLEETKTTPTPEETKKTQAPQTQPQASSTQNPTNEAGPAVIHEHPNETSIDNDAGYQGGLVRPSFYHPETTGPSSMDETPRANLEIGTMEEPPTQQEGEARVNKEDARIVHYESPSPTNDPFVSQTGPPKKKNEASNEEDKKDVPSEHVVDLKDLPK